MVPWWSSSELWSRLWLHDHPNCDSMISADTLQLIPKWYDVSYCVFIQWWFQSWLHHCSNDASDDASDILGEWFPHQFPWWSHDNFTTFHSWCGRQSRTCQFHQQRSKLLLVELSSLRLVVLFKENLQGARRKGAERRKVLKLTHQQSVIQFWSLTAVHWHLAFGKWLVQRRTA